MPIIQQMFREKLIKALQDSRFEWRKHTLARLAERDIPQDDILEVLKGGEMIEYYPEDTPFPSGLFFAKILDRPLHTVTAFDEQNNWVYIVTAYEPSLEHFEEDFKTRRKNEKSF